MGAILGSLVLGAAPLAGVPAVSAAFNPAWIQQFNVIIDGRVTVVPA